MKRTTVAIALALVVAGSIALVPVFNRIRQNNADQKRRSQLAANIHLAPRSAADQNSARWRAAAQAFDRSKTTAAAIFKGADKVEALRLFPVNSEKPRGQVAEFVPFFSRHAVNTTDFAARLGEIVLNAKSYAWPGQSVKQCYIEPAVAFRVWKGKQWTDTVICFKCDQLAVLEHNNKAPQRSIGSRLRGRFNVAGDFTARPQLLALTKEAFPDDKAVQSLR